ncbi:MAG: hypothetical protein QM741_08330 [Rudaea sp.]|uniref:hypothetical protein n=1 Tax=Rudaea sp. TaxID=2136325 RepID=UPI0039E63BF8
MVALRDLYDWMERLMVMACDIGFAPASKPVASHVAKRGNDIVVQTRELFEAIALATDHPYLYQAVRQADDKLGPIRRAKQPLVPDASDELAHINRLWRKRDITALKAALIAYHERRKQLVPRIVAHLSATPYLSH